MTEREAMTAARREYWAWVLEKTDGNVTQAARIAHVHRSTVYDRRVEYGFPVTPQRTGRWVAGRWESL